MSKPVYGGYAETHHDIALLIGRLLLAAVFLSSGFDKLMDMGKFTAGLASRGVPGSSVLGVIGPIVEFFGALCIIVGFQTRYAALLLLLFTAIATGIAHRFWEFPEVAATPGGPTRGLQYTHFMKNVAIMGGWLILSVAGPGRWSIDRRGK
jgi:putative oxidoreductase